MLSITVASCAEDEMEGDKKKQLEVNSALVNPFVQAPKGIYLEALPYAGHGR